MQKLSAEEKIRVLADVPEALRKLAAERDYYQKELLKRASDERLKKLASDMIDKGLKSGSVEKVAAELRAQASSGELDLGVTERAVEMFGPNMGKLASLSEESGHAGASSELDRYILS